MEYQSGSPLPGPAPAGARGPSANRISRLQVTVPPDIPKGFGRVEFRTLRQRFRPPNRALKAVDQRRKILLAQLVQPAEIGDHPLLHASGVVAVALDDLQIAAISGF